MSAAHRLYYDDSFLQDFSARVTDIREYARTGGQSEWQIALDRTAFYPTSGGQPFDRGTLTAQARSGAELVAEIENVMEDEAGEVWHTTRKPVLSGTMVTGLIDWKRRLDHMQQHSGQHLLSAVIAAELGARTVSFHLGESISTIDLEAEGSARQGELVAALEGIEQRVNGLIAEDLGVTVRTVEQGEAQALLTAGRLRKLPAREGTIRLVEIAGVDLNACGGTHVRSLGQIGSLLVRSTERTKAALRVEFVCGLRAVAAAGQDFASLSKAAAALSVGREAVGGAIERLLTESRSADKANQRLREELAQHHAVQLAIETRSERGLRVVVRSFADRDAGYVRLLASRLVASVPRTVAIFLSTVEEPASLVFACSSSLGCGCGARLKQALAELGLRGGGSADMAQTTLPRVQAERVAEQLANQLATELRTEPGVPENEPLSK